MLGNKALQIALTKGNLEPLRKQRGPVFWMQCQFYGHIGYLRLIPHVSMFGGFGFQGRARGLKRLRLGAYASEWRLIDMSRDTKGAGKASLKGLNHVM